MLLGYWIFHDFVSIKISFSKIYDRGRQLHISPRYPKLFGDSVIEESVYSIVCVCYCVYMGLFPFDGYWPWAATDWLCLSDFIEFPWVPNMREGLNGLIWFLRWFSPWSNVQTSADKAPSLKMLMLPHCDVLVCVHMYMHMYGPYFFSSTCRQEVLWWWVHHLNLPNTLRHSSKMVQNTQVWGRAAANSWRYFTAVSWGKNEICQSKIN